ncbi:MAG: hypothetical protein LBD03_08805 [Methanobrevibacter sp.]|jgi:uncharacterized membrane protein|nr:hypothetical protein [Candidatus Methanovirga procula]
MNTKYILLLIIFLSLVSCSYAENRTIGVGNTEMTDAYVLFSNGVNVSITNRILRYVTVDISPNDTYKIYDCGQPVSNTSRPAVLPRWGWVIGITSLGGVWGSTYEGF